MGQSDDASESKIWKKALRTSLVRCDAGQVLIAEMLTTLDTHAVHRFHITSEDDDDDVHTDSVGSTGSCRSTSGSVLIWILTPDARITASDIATTSPGARVVKVMFQHRQSIETHNINQAEGEVQTAEEEGEEEVETMQVTASELYHLRAALTRHHGIMGGETVEAWSPSFLIRYDGGTGET